MVGYFQMWIWLWEYPWVETSSLTFLAKMRLQTYDPVSMQSVIFKVSVFQRRIDLSAVPPPEASHPCWWGLQAIAFTAALWAENFFKGVSLLWADHRIILLSFPPEASYCWSGLHFKPQISYVWPDNFAKKFPSSLRSQWRIFLSLDPLERHQGFQLSTPILLWWPSKVLTSYPFWMSQIWRFPVSVPTAS